ncbi:fumarylacetoacetate hydrolase family protein [Nanchangia anserum]|uniref:fumarylacetoacetate hydrolase family protein n=1 Tax=Nanchangia anserum TaxID=2692125 RepID=UPI00188452F0|nr:fumarylacetoacetate hydrolase family protein [Nanchangia anserum]QOX81169.1 fumarylacetoacetate hydrolase family protein [Nanchangia anserum]
MAGPIGAQRVDIVPNTAIAGPDDPVVAPSWAGKIQVEAGIAIVVKTILKDVAAEAARDLALGTCLAARFTAADVDRGVASTWDRACPIGPWIEVMSQADPHTDAVTIEAGETVREVEPTPFRLEDALARASAIATLLPGDIVMVPWPARVDVAAGEHVTISHALLGDLHAVIRAN